VIEKSRRSPAAHLHSSIHIASTRVGRRRAAKDRSYDVGITGVCWTLFTVLHRPRNVLILFLRLTLGQLSSLPSRADKRALRGRHEAERDATDPSRLSGPSRGKQSLRSARRGLAGRRPAVGGGRPKDPANAEDRVSVKARYAVGCWGLQAEKSSRAERRRIAASVACCCRVLSAHGCHVLEAHGAAGAVKRPVVPHAPEGKERRKTTGEPRAGDERGVMMRV
jgi:hypothetical protein